jgi:thiol-disulfide isomerase/thioredoxin
MDASRKASRIWWPLLLVAVVALVSLPAARAQSAPQQNKKSAGRPVAVADPPIIDLDGYNNLLKKYHGKPILVNMWATWCEPCRFEYPMLVELEHENAPKGLVVIGVSFDEDADMNLVRHFLTRNHPGFTNYREKRSQEQAFIPGVNPQWNGSLPATLFYDRDGRLVGQFIGTRPRADFEQMIQGLLGAPHTRNYAPPVTGGEAQGSVPSNNADK